MVRRLSRRGAVACAIVAVLQGCTHGSPTQLVRVPNVALSPDGAFLGAIVMAERSRPATGLAAFPDGGVPQVLAQRADLYVVDLRGDSLLFRGDVVPSERHRVAFSPWLVGWKGDRLYFRITGCPESPDSECHGELVGESLHAVRVGGRIESVSSAEGAVLLSTLNRGARYARASVESSGVSFTRARGTRGAPLLRFEGERLVLVR